MLERLRQYSVQLVSLLLIAISFLLMRVSLENKELARFGTVALQASLAPFFEIQATCATYVSKTWKHYFWLTTVVEDNEKLAKEISLLKKENAELKEVYAEAQSLRDLLYYKETNHHAAVLATVIARSPSNWSKTIVLNRGIRDGLKIGSAVIDADAVVGQVISLTRDTAEVLLLTDYLSSIDGLLQDSRISGIVEGRGAKMLNMNYVIKFKDYLVQPGETVVTSGLDGVFPKGIVIGTVEKVNPEAKGLFQQISLKPRVDLLRLEHVLVLTADSGEQSAESSEPTAESGEQATEAEAESDV